MAGNRSWTASELEALAKAMSKSEKDIDIITEMVKATKRSPAAIIAKLWQVRKAAELKPTEPEVESEIIIKINGMNLKIGLTEDLITELQKRSDKKLSFCLETKGLLLATVDITA